MSVRRFTREIWRREGVGINGNGQEGWLEL